MSRGPDMSRREDLAGKSVKQGNHTVRYDDMGYAVSAAHDGGKSAKDHVKSTHANDSDLHRKMHDEASKGNWDEVGRLSGGLATGNKTPYGGQDFSKANEYMNELQDEFGYDAKDYYRDKYDDLYGKGTFDDPNHVVPYTGGALPNETGGQPIGGSASSSVNGTTTESTTGGGSNNYVEYLKNMYARNKEAELANLKNQYDQASRQYDFNSGKIDRQFEEKKGNALAQNEAQKMYMNEVGAANGLNTGASGQLALGQSMAYQNALAGIGSEQAAAQAQNDMLLQQLRDQYYNGINSANAKYDSAMMNAIYGELVRQDELNRQEAIRQSEIERQNEIRQQDLAREDAALAYQKALSLLNAGYMPTPDMLAAAGMSGIKPNFYKARRSYSGGSSSGGSRRSGGGNSGDDGYTGENVQVKQQDEEDRLGMNPANFGAYGRSIMGSLASGKPEYATYQLDGIWDQLSNEQRATMQAALQKHGITYNP